MVHGFSSSVIHLSLLLAQRAGASTLNHLCGRRFRQTVWRILLAGLGLAASWGYVCANSHVLQRAGCKGWPILCCCRHLDGWTFDGPVPSLAAGPVYLVGEFRGYVCILRS